MSAKSKVNPFFQKGFKPKTMTNSPKPGSVQKDEKSDDAKQWIEKYRPKTLSDVMSQHEVVKILTKCCETVDAETGAVELPNLLMYGPPGTGKTSSALALARDLFGPELVKERVLELNASDDRGIKIVRTKIKDFAQRTVKMQGLKQLKRVRKNGESYSRPPAALKLIVLDECDSMTRPAQEALRRTMEKYTTTTRFILIVNYITKIIGPIASRCAKLRFTPLDEESKRQRLTQISARENIEMSPEVIDGLVEIAKGDLRRCVNYLQSAVNVIERSENQKRQLERRHLDMVSVQVPKSVVEELLDAALNHDFEVLKAVVDMLIYDAYSVLEIFHMLATLVTQEPSLSNLQKSYILDKIGEADGALIDGADEFLQLLNVMSFIQTTQKTILD